MPPKFPSGWRGPRLVLAAFACFLLAWGIDAATADFGNGGVVAALTVYSEFMARAWEEFGFAKSLGVPMFHCVGESVLAREPYAHQAPIGWWFPSFGRWIFGHQPLGYRFFPTLFFIVAAFLLARLVLRRGNALAAASVVIFLLLCPASGLYGALPGIESIAFLATSIFLTVWYREPTSASNRSTYLTYLGLSQVAWSFAFVAPGVFLGELLRPRVERRSFVAFLLGFVQVGGVTLILLHLSLGTRSFDRTFGEVWHTATKVFTDGLSNRHETLGVASTVLFFPAQNIFSREALGAVGRGIFGLALAVAFLTRAGRRDPLTALGVPFLAQGLLSVLVFNSRSNTHGYYWLLTAPAFAIYLTVLHRTIAARLAPRFRKAPSPFRAHPLACLLLIGALAFDLPASFRLRSAMEAPGLATMAAGIDAFVPPGDWVCSFDAQVLEAMLHSKRRWTPPLLTPRLIEDVLAARTAGRVPFKNLWLQVSSHALEIPAVSAVADWLHLQSVAGRAQRLEVGDLVVYIF